MIKAAVDQLIDKSADSSPASVCSDINDQQGAVKTPFSHRVSERLVRRILEETFVNEPTADETAATAAAERTEQTSETPLFTQKQFQSE